MKLNPHFQLYLFLWMVNLLFAIPDECPIESHFRIPTNIGFCHPYLDCDDVREMSPIKLLAKGVVKNIWLVQWKQHLIVMSTLSDQYFYQDFQENLNNLKSFQWNPYVTRLFGSCGNSIFTQYYSKGDMNNLPLLFEKYKIRNFKDRLEYCINYVEILAFLHDHSMIMCDSSSLVKTLSQYLITDELNIVLNDLDALPKLTQDRRKVICGLRKMIGDLVAPEQKDPLESIKGSYNHSRVVPYDYKSDIWKIPEVCHWILSESIQTSNCLAQKFLNWIHQKCKSNDPSKRPEASFILKIYKLIKSLS